MKVTTAIILETRKPNPKELYPVKLRITFQRHCKYYTLKYQNKESIYLSEADFTRIIGDRPRDSFKKLKILLNAYEEKAIKDIESLPVFTFEKFERKFFGKTEGNNDVIGLLRAKANRLRVEGRISTAVAYECSLRSIVRFFEKEVLPFEKVDIIFLNEYEKWMLTNGNSNTTISMYVRNLRAVFNEAISKGQVNKELYPFGKDKYVVPSGRNVKKALSISEVGLIASYPVIEGSSQHRYRDYWMFSYLCNGINVKDIALLRYSNISGELLTFVRAKTQRENKANIKPISLVITKEIGRIIDKWGNKPGLPNTYLFPILEKGQSPEQEYGRIQQTTKLINKYVGAIAEKLELKDKVTSYTARHSFATVLKRSGAPIEFISESLGHNTVSTTENYLADFEIDEKRKWAAKLTQF